MRATPREKTPPISPIFISDKVTLHVSREKDGKLRLVYARWDDAKVVGATIAAMSADMRGNTDETWSHTLDWLVQNRLLAPGYGLQ